MFKYIKKPLGWIIKGWGFIRSLFEFIAKQVASNAFMVGALATTAAGGLLIDIAQDNSTNGRINNVQAEQRAFEQQVQAIQEVGSENTDELRRLLVELSDELRRTAETVQGEIQQSLVTAANNLQQEADRIDSDVVITQQDLETSLDETKQLLETSDIENKDELGEIIDSVTTALQTSIEANQSSISGVESTISGVQSDVLQVYDNQVSIIGNILNLQAQTPDQSRNGRGITASNTNTVNNDNVVFDSPFTECTNPVVVASINVSDTSGFNSVIVNVDNISTTGFTLRTRIDGTLGSDSAIPYSYIAQCPL